MNNKDVGKIWDKKWENLDVDKFKKDAFENDAWTICHKPIIDKYLEKIPKDGVFLEAGCGMGHWCYYASDKFKIKSVGVDVAEETIKKLQENNNNGLVEFILDDLNDSKLEKCSFDMLISLGVVEHFKDSNQMMKNLYGILKLDGVGIITVPNLYSIHTITRPISKLINKWDIGYEKSFSPAKLRKLAIANNFKVIESGVLPSGELFGCFLNDLPVIGKLIKKISLFIEMKQKTFGFASFVVVKK